MEANYHKKNSGKQHAKAQDYGWLCSLEKGSVKHHEQATVREEEPVSIERWSCSPI
jgi:hypothetical protein